MINVNIGSAAYDAPFPADALEQEHIAASVRIGAYVQQRLDLRAKPAFTFSAREDSNCDCAYSIEERRDGRLLTMHVIDADEFVCAGSPLDREAAARFSSFRAPSGKHYTMLPASIYENVLAFRPGEDRLAISVFMQIDDKGRLVKINIDRSIVRVSLHCVFGEVDALYAQSDRSVVLPLREKYTAAMPSLDRFYELGGLLFGTRLAAGCPDILTYRTVCSYSDGRVSDMYRVPDWDIGMVVREFLRFAGASVASFFVSKGIPCVFTGREPLDKTKIEYLARISGFDGDISGEPEDVTRRLAHFIRLSPETELLGAELCYALEASRYYDKPHRNTIFALDAYIRFAHPSSLYTDLLVQRIMKAGIDAGFEQANLNISRMKRELAAVIHAFNKLAAEREELWAAIINDCQRELFSRGGSYSAAYVGGETPSVLLPWGLVAPLVGAKGCGSDFVTVDGKRKPLLTRVNVRVVNPDIPSFCFT